MISKSSSGVVTGSGVSTGSEQTSTGSGVSTGSEQTSTEQTSTEQTSNASNIVAFPEKRKTEIKREQLEKEIQALNELYAGLERGYQIVTKLENDIDQREATYNYIFEEYVKSVEDHESIEIRLLNYCSNANIVEDENGNLRIEFEGDQL